ncbi:hypothetical protein [Pseudarthrobacter sp. WHRI 8279]|jgi:hypothetical protein
MVEPVKRVQSPISRDGNLMVDPGKVRGERLGLFGIGLIDKL